MFTTFLQPCLALFVDPSGVQAETPCEEYKVACYGKTKGLKIAR